MKIGVTLGLKDNKESIWTNGIKLNVLNLVRLLKKSQMNYEVCILNTIKVDWSVKPDYLQDINIYDFDDKFMDMDLIIIMGSQIHDDKLKQFKNGNNKKVISYKCGNNYILHVEETLFKPEVSSHYETSFDEVWYIPQQHENNNGYYHTLYRTNSIIVPFLWDSQDLDMALKDVDNSFETGKFKKDTKYVPKDKKTLGVMEPNLNVIKYGLIPTMIAEESYRTKVGKDKINKLMLTNSEKLGKTKNFLSILKTFDLYKDKKITSESRYQTAYIVSQYMDVVISHQLMNPLNYLYMDVVHMGYPVLHNAYMCKDLGYYYEGSSTVDGANQLNWILENHDKNIEEYKERNKKVLDRYSINNSNLIKTYDKLIDNLMYGDGNKNLSYDVKTNLYTNLDLTEKIVEKKIEEVVKREGIMFYVIHSNEERLDFMKRQMLEMDLIRDTVFFKAYTPEDSQNWVVKNDKYTTEKLQSCFRSHISSIKHFTDNYKDKKYICILEDDVCLAKDKFKEKLLTILENFEKNKEIDYLSVGYLPTTINNKTYTFNSEFLDNEKLSLVNKKDGIYYGFKDKGFTIWGAQAQIFPFETCEKIVNLLYKKTGTEVYDSVNTFILNNPIKQNKVTYLTPDSIIPILFEQGITHPPLAIEGDNFSTIHHSSNSNDRIEKWKKYEEMGYIKNSDFYN